MNKAVDPAPSALVRIFVRARARCNAIGVCRAFIASWQRAVLGLFLLVSVSALLVYLVEYLLAHTGSISLPDFSLMGTLAAGASAASGGSSQDNSREGEKAGLKEDLADLLKYYRAIMEASLDGIHILGTDGNLVDANDAFCKMLGYARAELLGCHVSHWDSRWSREELDALMQGGAGSSGILETRHRCKDGRLIDVEISFSRIEVEQGAYWIASSRDITERNRIQGALKESEDRLHQMFEQSPVAMATYLNGICIDVNEAYMQLFALDERADICGKPIIEFIAPEARDAVAERAKRRDQGLAVEQTYETIGLRKNGVQFSLSVTAGRIDLGAGSVNIAYLTDVSDHKLAVKAEQARLRTVTLLSRSNAMIARATNEQELLQDACKLAVEVGGYMMSWFGAPMEDGTVKPVAQSGYEDGYLESIRVSWLDEPEGRGPIGLAVRSGKSVAIQDILHDPRMALWHVAATRRGYNASVALPMCFEQEVMGVLTIYSPEQNAFGSEEVHLLEELVSDMAFGIVAMRVRKEKEAALHALELETEKNLALLRNAGEGIHIVDAGGTIIEVSDAFCKKLGYRREEVIGMNISDWGQAPFKLKAPPLTLTERLSRNEHSTYETRYLSKYGRVLDVEVRSFPLTLGGKMVLFNSWRDITHSKAAFNALRENEQKLRGLYELSPLGIALRKLNGAYVDFNEAYRKITGYDALELKTMDNWMLTPPEYAEAEARQIDLLSTNGRYGPYEKEYIRKDGVRIPVRLSGVMVRGQDGRSYVWSIVEDISESRRIQAELASNAAQLRSLLGNYEATLESERAHIAREIHDELGQNLTSLGFELSALRLSVDMNNPRLAELINTMSSLTSRAIQVTRNVAENLRPTAMNMGIVPAIEWLGNMFTAHSGVLYRLSASEEFDDMAQAQVDVLFRIVQESLTNVLRHAKAGNVAIALARQDGKVQVRIADDGVGFETGDSGRPRSYGLLGMQERAVMMGGRIDVQSAPGQGTEITVWMPYRAKGRK